RSGAATDPRRRLPDQRRIAPPSGRARLRSRPTAEAARLTAGNGDADVRLPGPPRATRQQPDYNRSDQDRRNQPVRAASVSRPADVAVEPFGDLPQRVPERFPGAI